MKMPLFCIITSTLLTLAPHVEADEFFVRIPRSFETEVFVENRYEDQFEPTQYQVAEIRFIDYANYRIRSLDATTIQREFVEGGLNLICGESETVVVGGQCLSLSRQSQKLNGRIPKNRDELESMLKENSRIENWAVTFASNDDSLRYFLGRLPALGILVGSLDLLSTDRSAFSITRDNSQAWNPNEVKFSTTTNKVSHRGTIKKWHDGWRIAHLESTYSKNSFTNMLSVQEQDTELVLDSDISKSGDEPKSRAKARMRKILFDGDFPIELSQNIANGTPVTLTETPQIKAVWIDDKVVRVYEGGTVDDLGSATFHTSSGAYGIVKILLITIGFAAVGGWLMWMRKSRSTVN